MSTKDDVLAIFQAALDRVNPKLMIEERIDFENNQMIIRSDKSPIKLDLEPYNRILVLGAGKASARMALGLESILKKQRLAYDGVVSVKYGHLETLERIELIEAGHPVPDSNSFRAGELIFQKLKEADEKTLVISLISGGGSALLCKPFVNSQTSSTITEGDMQEITGLLLGAGTAIEDINCIRKHISGIKGGRFAEAAFPAQLVNIILSDVVGDPLDAIASGLGVPDTTGFDQAVRSLKRYMLWEKVPASIREHLEMGLNDSSLETPKEGNPIFSSVSNIILGNNGAGLVAAKKEAESLGYRVQILSSRLEGEAREVAKVFSSIAKDYASENWWGQEKICVMTGGETTVTLRGNGKGGRNQELALSYALEIAGNNKLFSSDRLEDIVFLSGASDGNDGPTDAAGGIITRDVLEAIEKDIPGAIAEFDNNNAYKLLRDNGGLVITGPTNTNVCDFQILLLPGK